MSGVKGNIIANYFGQGWAALMSLAFIPYYISVLGIEAYGLIGVNASIIASISLLDMGMSPTITREIARYSAGARSLQSIRDLLRSLEVLCFSIAIFIAICVWFASGWLASNWLKADTLTTGTISKAISIMALVASLTFMGGIYRGALYGLQRQVLYNSINAIYSTLRFGGVFLLLTWVSASIEVFFFWQAFVALVNTLFMAAWVHRTLPKSPKRAKFSWKILAGVWNYASKLMANSFLNLSLTQMDKIILSRLWALESFGYYTMAASIAGVLWQITGPIAYALFPRMVEHYSRKDHTLLMQVYHYGAQMVSIVTAPAAILLMVFSGDVIFMWSGKTALSVNVGPILAIYVIGTFLHCQTWIPFQYANARGKPTLFMKFNLLLVICAIPSFWVLISHYGAIGAAWVWVMIGVAYFFIFMPFFHNRLAPGEIWKWYLYDVILPVTGPLVVIGVAQLARPQSFESRVSWFIYFMVTAILSMASSVALANEVRVKLRHSLSALVRTCFQKVA